MNAVAILSAVGMLAAGPRATTGTKPSRAMVATYVATYAAASRGTSLAIPAWARKYNMNCSGCHYPAPPRLNATGTRFKWAGYRMPEEIGEDQAVEKIQNYLAGHAVVQYEWNKTSGQPSSNAFAMPEVGLFYAGPVGRHFSGFLEFERNPDGTTDALAVVSGMWGNQSGYGGFRFGQMHGIAEAGIAGFDRPISANDIAPLGPVTSAIPFAFDVVVGGEAYVVRGSNRLAFQITNGIDATGSGAPGGSGPSKDFALVDQWLYDQAGSGLEAVAYYGTLRGIDTLQAGLDSRYWRLALTANKIYHNVELLGGVVYGRDMALPLSLALPNNENKGLGYWVSGQYYMPDVPLVLFGRFEHVDPNTQLANDAVSYVDFGTVLPINLPQYMKATVEYRMTSPQGGLAKTNDLIAEFQLNF
jgi:hypothetical protein